MFQQQVSRIREILDFVESGGTAEIERLDLEVKGFSPIGVQEAYSATISKAVMCLSNHGGGTIVVGYSRQGQGYLEEVIDQHLLQSWEKTRLHDVFRTYMAPVPECELLFEQRSKSIHPILIVPSHGTTPVVCTRDSSITRRGAIYVRKPGPVCEEPQSPAEWAPVIRRATLAERMELTAISDSLTLKRTSRRAATKADLFIRHVDFADSRFRELCSTFETESVKKAKGRWTIAHQIVPSPLPVSLSRLLSILDDSEGHETGWPIGVTLDKEEYRPRPLGRAIEAWIADGIITDHLDYWYARPDSFFFATRGLQEDLSMQPGGGVFEWILPIWRMGEGILHAVRMDRAFGSNSNFSRFLARYDGLAGRTLWNSRPEIQGPMQRHICRVDTWSNEIRVPKELDLEILTSLLVSLLSSLYEQFDFFEMPRNVYLMELKKMVERGRSFQGS